MESPEYWIFKGTIFQNEDEVIFIHPQIYEKIIYGTIIYSKIHGKNWVETVSSFERKYSRKLEPWEIIKYKLLGYIK